MCTEQEATSTCVYRYVRSYSWARCYVSACHTHCVSSHYWQARQAQDGSHNRHHRHNRHARHDRHTSLALYACCHARGIMHSAHYARQACTDVIPGTRGTTGTPGTPRNHVHLARHARSHAPLYVSMAIFIMTNCIRGYFVPVELIFRRSMSQCTHVRRPIF